MIKEGASIEVPKELEKSEILVKPEEIIDIKSAIETKLFF